MRTAALAMPAQHTDPAAKKERRQHRLNHKHACPMRIKTLSIWRTLGVFADAAVANTLVSALDSAAPRVLAATPAQAPSARRAEARERAPVRPRQGVELVARERKEVAERVPGQAARHRCLGVRIDACPRGPSPLARHCMPWETEPSRGSGGRQSMPCKPCLRHAPAGEVVLLLATCLPYSVTV